MQGLNNLAVVYTQQGRAQDALQMLHAAVMAAPTYAEAHNNLGVLQVCCGVQCEMCGAWCSAVRCWLGEMRFARVNGIGGGVHCDLDGDASQLAASTPPPTPHPVARRGRRARRHCQLPALPRAGPGQPPRRCAATATPRLQPPLAATTTAHSAAAGACGLLALCVPHRVPCPAPGLCGVPSPRPQARTCCWP